MMNILFALLLFLPGMVAAQGGQPPVHRAVIDLTIGTVSENRDDYIFEDIRGLTLDGQGRLFVAEYKANEVRVFSGSGRLLYKIGRHGAGPGDLDGPCCISLAPDGRLWVKEFTNHRYSIFQVDSTRGVFRWSLVLPRAVSYGGDGRITWNAEGEVADINGLPAKDGHPTGLLRTMLDSTGRATRLDSFPEAPPDSVEAAVHFQNSPNGGRGSAWVLQPFGPTRLRAFGPAGLSAQAMSSRYGVEVKDATGKRLALLPRVVSGPVLSARERQFASTTIKAIESRWNESLPFGVPDRKPPLADLGFDLDGRLWVELSVPNGQPHVADVYDENFRRIATMEWPSNVRLASWAIRGMTGLGVARDSLGTMSVVRLQFR